MPEKMVRLAILTVHAVLACAMISHFFLVKDGWLSDPNEAFLNGKHARGELVIALKEEPLRYVFISSLKEQLGKARYHFAEWMYIARSLNRTLVLPRVGRSELSMQESHNFSFYYNVSLLRQYVPVIEFADFQQTLLNFPVTPSVDFLWHVDRRDHCANKGGQIPEDVRRALRLNVSRIVDTSPRCVVNPFSNPPPDNGPQIECEVATETLITELARNTTADILVITKRGYYSLVPITVYEKTLPYLDHNQALEEVVRKVSMQLTPYVALQWRMETGTAERMGCATSLVQMLQNITTAKNITNIYFAVDYATPTERKALGGKGKSNSWYEGAFQRAKTADAWQFIVESLRPHTWSTSIANATTITDPGQLSILEKLVMVEANTTIIVGKPCGRGGMFGQEIMARRQARWGNEKSETIEFLAT